MRSPPKADGDATKLARLRSEPGRLPPWGAIELARLSASITRPSPPSVGDTGEILLELLERRLDNVVYRLGFARSRALARQLVRHGHFLVNDRPVDIPSFQVSIGERISVKPGRRNRAYFQLVHKEVAGIQPPGWLNLDREALQGTVTALPDRSNTGVNLNLQLIVEYYSR
jgi:small subunit ribosomal protein S4